MLKQHNSIDTRVVFNTRPGYSVISLANDAGYYDHDRWLKWVKILQEAKDNPALNDLIKQAEMVYELTR